MANNINSNMFGIFVIGMRHFETYFFLFGAIGGTLILTYLLYLSTAYRKFMLLSLFVAIITVDLSIHYLAVAGHIKDMPHLIYANEPLFLLLGPLIYMYARNQGKPELVLKRTDLLFAVPAVMSLLNYLPFYLQDRASKLEEQISVAEDISENIWEWQFIIIVNAVFLGAALTEIKRYSKALKEQAANLVHIDLRQTELMVKLILGIYAAELVIVYASYYGLPYDRALFAVLYVLKIVLLIMITIDALKSYRHLVGLQADWVPLDLEEAKEDTIGHQKYKKTLLTDVAGNEILIRLENFMLEEKPYRSPSLRIKTLAELTNIPAHHISQVINQKLGQNFYEFVNSYRIKEAQQILNSETADRYTITAIGHEVGFNSKTAFYTAFKKYTGLTPSEFKKN